MAKAHEIWRQNYREDRYLKHLPDNKLYERCSHLMSNLMTLDVSGKVGILSESCSPHSKKFIIKFTHVLTELELRGQGLPKGLLNKVATPSPSLEMAVRFQDLKSRFSDINGCLYKFGQWQFLSKYSFKIALASTYEKNRNISMQDSELARVFTPPPSRLSITSKDNDELDTVKNVEVSFSTNWDYYIFCTSRRLDFRMFDDFDADCILVIKNISAFSKILSDALQEVIPLEQMKYGPINYFDPILNEDQKEPDVQFSKHFKYSYQREHRHAFIPMSQQSLPKEVIIEIPELSNFCDLVRV